MPREADEKAHRYMGTYLGSLLEHYEVMGDHFAVTEGYDAYAKAAEVLRRVGESGFLQMFMKATCMGHAGADPGQPRGPPRADRSLRVHHRLPLRRHPLRGRRGVHAAVRR